MGSDSGLVVTVVMNEVHYGRAIDPLAPVQASRRESCDHTLTSAPQPSGPGTQRGSNLCVPSDVNISEKSEIASA